MKIFICICLLSLCACSSTHFDLITDCGAVPKSKTGGSLYDAGNNTIKFKLCIERCGVKKNGVVLTEGNIVQILGFNL